METSIRRIQALAFTLALLTGAGIAPGAPYDATIRVRVFDADASWQLPGARVSWCTENMPAVPGSSGEGTTGSLGSYSFTPSYGSGHTYKIVVTCRDYRAEESSVVAVPGQNSCTVSLVPVHGTPTISADIAIAPTADDPSCLIEIWAYDPDADEPTFGGCRGTLAGEMVSGPGGVSITISGTPGSCDYCAPPGPPMVGCPQANCTFTRAGDYELRFTYTGEYGDTASATVTITVPGPPVNQCPVVNAGPDVTTTASFLPWSWRLEGTANDPDDGPDLTAEPRWLTVSGPGTPAFDDSTDPDTHVTFPQAGRYILQLSYSDGECSTADEVIITVHEKGATTVQGTVTESGTGAPIVGAVVSLGTMGVYEQCSTDLSGYYRFSGVEIEPYDHIVAQTLHYVAQEASISVMPGGVTTQDFVMTRTNGMPIVDAGPATTYTVPSPPGDVGIELTGSVEDPDWLPTVGVPTWSQESGPGTVSFKEPLTWPTTAYFSDYGSYVMKLEYSDGEFTVSDTTTVTIEPDRGSGCEPLVYLSLDEAAGTTAYDLSGNDHNGTLIGNSQRVDGTYGTALKFDGRDDCVDTTFSQDLPRWTICGWVSSPAAPSDGAPSGPIHRGQNFQINWNHGDAKFRAAAMLNVGGVWYRAGFGSLAANTWYHLAASYDGISLKAYRDGELITTTSCPGVPTAESSSLKLGRHAAAANFFSGTVDDVYVYPCALTQAEIEALMNKGVMDILEVVDNGVVDHQQMCYASLDSRTGTRIEYTAPVLDLWDNGPRGHFGNDEPFEVVRQSRKTAGNVENLSLRAEGVIRISPEQAGDWTFGVNSDDGFTLVFPGRGFVSVTDGNMAPLEDGKAIRFYGGRALADTLGVINLPAGDHRFWLTYHEGGALAGLEFFAAPGIHAQFDPDLFRLVGQRAVGAVGVPGFCDQVSMLATKPGTWSGGLIDSIADARAALGRTSQSVKCEVINHADPDTIGAGSGTFPGDIAFPNDVVGTDDDDFAVKVTGLLDIPVDGVYQIGFNSDDGASLRITGKSWQSIVADGTGKAVIVGDELINDAVSGSTFTVGQIALTKGCHAFEAVMFERSGSSLFELLGRGVSDRGIPDPTWHLLCTGGASTSVDVRGLQLVDP